VGFRLDGRESITRAGERAHVPPGTAHYRWNAWQDEAHVAVEVRPGASFEEMTLNHFGLAQDGQTNPEGMPGFLQAAIFAREFAGVSYLAKPPLPVRGMLFGILAAVARALGYGAATRSAAKPRGRTFRAAKGAAHRPPGW
jgi:hypothetical protein